MSRAAQTDGNLRFLFAVLPVLFQSYESSATQPLRFDVQLEPKTPDITFNPWQIFFLGTNKVRVPPARIWQDHKFLGTNTLKAFPATNCTRFFLEFSPWDQVYPDYLDRSTDHPSQASRPLRWSAGALQPSKANHHWRYRAA